MRPPPPLPPRERWQPLLQSALTDDLGPGDATSELVIPVDADGRARIEARQALVVCGLPVAREVFERVDGALAFEIHKPEGAPAAAGEAIAHVSGSLRSILLGERTALNFLGRLCGVATLARRYVAAVEGTGAEIVDTRKTLPGWRALDKYATAVGGARNHRHGLYDGILLKDNHVAAAGGVEAALALALAGAPAGLRVQIEVQSEAEALAACEAGADFLLIDNCKVDEVARIVQRCGQRALLEASGGIDLDTLRAYADTGVQRISVGALTHSAAAADLSLELVPADARPGESRPGGAGR